VIELIRFNKSGFTCKSRRAPWRSVTRHHARNMVTAQLGGQISRRARRIGRAKRGPTINFG
jgi:hypothetical protein